MNITNRGTILVGHGELPSDFPSEQVSKLMRLEKERRCTKQDPSAEEMEIDRTLRHWPRTASSDPYKAGLEQLLSHLSPLFDGMMVNLAYNEFSAPNLTEAIEECR
jgi:sirohydrochlorin cobaltochelatase